MYFFKHLIDFVKVDFLLLKTAKKCYLICLLLSFVAIFILSFLFKNNEKFIEILFLVQQVAVWSFFVYFFTILNKQNFFQHLILNRGFYITEVELFLFLIPLWFLLCLLVFPLYIFIQKYTIDVMFVIFLVVIDALFFISLKLKRYIIFNLIFVLILSIITFSFVIHNIDFSGKNVNETILLIENRYNKIDSKMNIINFIKLLIEMFLIKKALIKSI